MKTMTCREMGGPCDESMSAVSSQEMIEKGMIHLETAHPDMAADVKKMSKEEMDKWGQEFQGKWDAKMEDAPAAAPTETQM